MSQEIARQMINYHQCKVILVFEPNVPLPSEKNECKSFSFERVYRCNFLDHNHVKQLRNEILQTDGTIDILIENGRMPSSAKVPFSFSPDRFIEETSNKIIITLNVSTYWKRVHTTLRTIAKFSFSVAHKLYSGIEALRTSWTFRHDPIGSEWGSTISGNFAGNKGVD